MSIVCLSDVLTKVSAIKTPRVHSIKRGDFYEEGYNNQQRIWKWRSCIGMEVAKRLNIPFYDQKSWIKPLQRVALRKSL